MPLGMSLQLGDEYNSLIAPCRPRTVCADALRQKCNIDYMHGHGMYMKYLVRLQEQLYVNPVTGRDHNSPIAMDCSLPIAVLHEHSWYA